MNAYMISLIRTTVPAGVGAALAWLAGIGLNAGNEANAGLVTFGTALAIIVYYGLIRAVEPKLPAWLRTLLIGASTAPVYTPTVPAPLAFTDREIRRARNDV